MPDRTEKSGLRAALASKIFAWRRRGADEQEIERRILGLLEFLVAANEPAVDDPATSSATRAAASEHSCRLRRSAEPDVYAVRFVQTHGLGCKQSYRALLDACQGVLVEVEPLKPGASARGEYIASIDDERIVEVRRSLDGANHVRSREELFGFADYLRRTQRPVPRP